jgi:hypothetical protein
MKRSLSELGRISLLAISVLVVCSSLASAIPGSQARCAFDIIRFTTEAPIPGLAVRVNNTGTRPRRTLVQLSADTCVPPDSEVRVSYAVDEEAPQIFGPTNFANNQPFCQTHTTIAVIPIPPGRHTIQPFFRLQGPGEGAMINRCVTVDLTTK